MKKKVLLLCACICGITAAQAQISTGSNTAQTIRTGNRAEAGDFGLYLGATTNMFEGIGDDKTKVEAMPLLNFKYMCTDKVEARLGFEWWSKTNTGKQKEEDSDKAMGGSERKTNIMFYPGIAYHFNRSNILDVYVGAELPIGGGANSSKTIMDGYKDYDDEDLTHTSTRFEIGLGGFIGLQAYICNLPLAVGLEYGFNFRNCHVSNGTLSNDSFTIADNSFRKDYSSNRFVLGNQARLTFTYFFKL